MISRLLRWSRRCNLGRLTASKTDTGERRGGGGGGGWGGGFGCGECGGGSAGGGRLSSVNAPTGMRC